MNNTKNGETMAESGLIARDEAIVLVVDVQEKLAAVMEHRDATIQAVAKLVGVAKRLSIPILVTEQYPQGLGPTVPEVQDALGEFYQPISKVTFGCCEDDSFRRALANLEPRKHVIVCGLEAHVCVLQPALQLRAAEYAACGRRLLAP